MKNETKDKLTKQSKNKIEYNNSDNMSYILSSILSIIIFILATITFFGAIGDILSYNIAGEFGGKLFEAIYNFLGIWAYIVSILLFYISYIVWDKKEHEWDLKKITAITFIVIGISNILSIIDNYFKLTTKLSGIIFYEIGTKFIKLFGLIPLSILSVCVTYIGYILLTNRRYLINIDSKFEIFDNVKNIFSMWNSNKKNTDNIEIEEEVLEEVLEEESEEELEIKKEKPTLHEEVFKEFTKNETEEVIVKNKVVKNKNIIDTNFIIPPFDILAADGEKGTGGDTKAKGMDLKRTLNEFGIAVEMYGTRVGPSVTRYTLKPAQGVNVRKILSLKDNLQMAISATNMHIEAPIPGQPYVGIEIPNEKKQKLGLRSIIDNEDFVNSGKLTIAIGRDIIGNAVYGNIEDMPHLLIAGATKSGKSVTVQNLIVSLLYKNSPEDLKMIIIDPKRVEFTIYKNLPHLGTPVLTDAKSAVKALNWAIGEMEKRYEYFSDKHAGIQNIADYHSKIYNPAIEKAKKKSKDKNIPIEEMQLPEQIPYIIIIFDEFNDFMLSYPKEITAAITSLTQKGRAAGIHLILATQRPDVKVITGTIKANIPSRIALKTSSSIDSRTILDQIGAEDLLGKGDMLYIDPNHPRPIRLQAPYVSTEEVKKVIDFIKDHYYNYEAPVIDISKEKVETKIFGAGPSDSNDNNDSMNNEEEPADDEEYNKAKEYVIATNRASTSSLQARFGWGYPKAQKFIIMMERYGIIGPLVGNKREILVGTAQLEKEADVLLEEKE